MESIFSHIEAPPGTRLSDVIAEQIERRIVEGELRPGDALPAERELARQLSVSRPSLREALLKLEARDLLELRRNSGYTVAEVTAPSLTDPLLHLMEGHAKALGDVLELRQGLETMAAGLAAMRAEPADIERMREAAEATERAHEAGDAITAANWDARFHLAVAEATHNVALAHVMRGMFSVMRENVRRAREALFTREDAEHTLREQHRALADAIAAHDPEAAVRAAEAHLGFIREGIEWLQR
ncbi:FCD domain-containing protein [Arhodomonas sp. SL1]|uniref:FCD domain-containing protein n=1 Tax=Arhodomonas sp. SL1 TaxID=3425691 RepID=UPI003F884290